MSYYLLTIAYDGTNFHGWQRQPGLRTVQGEIEKTLSDILSEEVEIHGVSRTDAGVHAYAQRAGFNTEKPIPPQRLMIAINNALCNSRSRGGRQGDIQIKAVSAAPELQDGFHARHNAVGKTYIYRIISSLEPDIFLRNYYWQIPIVPDVEKMREAAAYLIGTHDFKAFQSAGGNEAETTVKTIYNLRIYQEPKESKQTLTTIEITGSGFLYNMVRIITGALLEVGEGKRAPEYIKQVLESKDRTLAGPTAPPQGLYLAEVYY
jgi:tRNA pseudouridine38-40 synthase